MNLYNHVDVGDVLSCCNTVLPSLNQELQFVTCSRTMSRDTGSLGKLSLRPTMAAENSAKRREI